MPIPGYGVLRGRPARKADATRRSPHYQVLLQAAKRSYRVAVNVQSQDEPDELLYYLDQDFQHPLLAGLVKVADGFTAAGSQFRRDSDRDSRGLRLQHGNRRGD